ncbi:MAG: hypothetical protein J6W88_04640 [Bacteroidales bacterium]|nr:hypothetical protein [Bacteroidales bacterium]
MMKKIFGIMAAALLLCVAACTEKEDGPDVKPEQRYENPRYLAAADGKVYVSCYSPTSVLRIDTATSKVEAVCRLGHYNPEGMVIEGGRLFVVSSWIADEVGNPVYDDKVYVVDLATFAVETTVTVGLNPQRILSLGDGRLIVNYNGDYNDVAAGSAIIDANSLTVTQTGIEMTSMCVADGMVYGYNAPYGSGVMEFFSYDPSNGQQQPILGGATISGNPYSISMIDGDIYVTTATYNANGDVYRFAGTGSQLWRSEAGVYASKVVPVGDGTAYVLNEGSWGGNNASLSRVELATGNITNGVFAAANSRGLGDVAQDIIVYGTKAYIAVSFSNTVEVVSVSDNKAKQIKL